MAKIGYMQKWIFLKNISSNFAYIAPKLFSRAIINDDILLFLYPNCKNFHDERFCDFGQKLTLTGWNWRGPPTTPRRSQSDPKTLPTGKIHNHKSCWPTLGPFRYSWGGVKRPIWPKTDTNWEKSSWAPHDTPWMPKNNTNQSACLGFIDIVPFGTLPGLWGILWGPNGALSAPKTVFFYRCKTPQWPVRAEMGLNLNIIKYFTRGKCFRVTLIPPGCHGALRSFSPS